MFGISIFLVISTICCIAYICFIIINRKDTYLSRFRLLIKAIGLELEIESKEKSAPSQHDKH
jgi:hypothetical protein